MNDLCDNLKTIILSTKYYFMEFFLPQGDIPPFYFLLMEHSQMNDLCDNLKTIILSTKYYFMEFFLPQGDIPPFYFLLMEHSQMNDLCDNLKTIILSTVGRGVRLSAGFSSISPYIKHIACLVVSNYVTS